MNRRLRRYYLIVLLLPNIFTLGAIRGKEPFARKGVKYIYMYISFFWFVGRPPKTSFKNIV